MNTLPYNPMVTYNELGIVLILAIVAITIFVLRVDIKKFL